MKQLVCALLFCLVYFCASGQRKSTTVKSYYKKDGTFVRSHTRHYNSGSSSTSGNYTNRSALVSEEEIVKTDLALDPATHKNNYKKVGGIKVTPTSLVADTNGVVILVAVLPYNDSTVLDICPLPRSILTFDYETSSTSLYFKIPKDRIKPEHTIELVSKYHFQLTDDFLTKTAYPGLIKVDLPQYVSLKLEAIALK